MTTHKSSVTSTTTNVPTTKPPNSSDQTKLAVGLTLPIVAVVAGAAIGCYLRFR